MNLFPATRYKPHTSERGFTLLLAALISSIVLAMATSIFGIVSKEITLSSVGRDSQFAFYAADEGAECALYWDSRFGYFATSAPPNVIAPDPRCDAQTLVASGRSAVYPYTMTFSFEPNGYCTTVSVQKSLDASNAVATVIHADGFSTTCATQTTAPRSLQRSVELRY